MTKSSLRARSHFSRACLAFTALTAVSVSLPSVAQAQDAPESSESTFAFDLPSQPLARTVTAISSRAGLQVFYADDAGPGDVTAPAVSGTMTADEALSRATAGTGFIYRYLRPGVITLEPAGEGGSRTIGPVRVEGAEYETGAAMPLSGVNGSMDVTATEGTGSYTTGLAMIGSKTPLSIKDTPQSVSVMTAQTLEDQSLSDFTEALTAAPGLTMTQGNSSLESSFYSRGFRIADIQTDGGAPFQYDFGYYPQIDMSQYDHIEILRGAAGQYSGYGNPGGTVNLVRKKPLDHQQVTWEGQIGSWNTYRSVLDVTGPLAFDDNLRGRLVVTYQDNEYFYDTASDNKTLIYGVLDYDVTPTTLLTAGISYTRQDSVPWVNGLGRYETGKDLGLSRSVSYVFPWNSWDFETTEYFATLEQRLWGDWNARLNVTHNYQENVEKVGYVEGPVNPETMVGPTYGGSQEKNTIYQLALDASVTGSFTLLGEKQDVAFGFSRGDTDGSGALDYPYLVQGTSSNPFQPYPGGPIYCGSASGCPAGSIPETYPLIGSPFDFDANAPLYTEPAGGLPSSEATGYGQVISTAYANFNFTAFEKWHLATSLRWSRYESTVETALLCTNQSSFFCMGQEIGYPYLSFALSDHAVEDFAWPPSVSLSYDITDDITAYVGYTDIYQSLTSYYTKDGEPIDPITGANVEAGVKWAARDGRLNLTLAGYWITKDNYSVRTNETPNFTLGQGQMCCYTNASGSDQSQESKGFDLEAAGEITPGWQISSSYSYSKNEQVGTYYGENEGQPFTSIQPEHLIKIWTSYDFAASPWGDNEWLSRLTLSGGLNWQSEAFRSGSVCTGYEQAFDDDGNPVLNNSGTLLFNCTAMADYDFISDSYGVLSARAEYALNDVWDVALNVENLTDETYYQTIGTASQLNWYGAPTSYTLSLKGRW